MTANVNMKIKILRKSMGTFTTWLDSCDALIRQLPQELRKSDSAHLRDLALKYKDLLLQMKERCEYMQEVNNLCKDVERETTPPQPTATPPLVSESSGVVNPVTGSAEAVSGATEPVSGATEPVSRATEPTEPVSEAAEPVAEATEPVSNASEPGSEEIKTVTTDNKSDAKETSASEAMVSSALPINPSGPLSPPPTSSSQPNSPVPEPGSPSTLNPELAALATEVKDLNVRFANVCLQAKDHYASLSKVLTASIERQSSKRSSTRSTRVHYVKISAIGDKNSLSRQTSEDGGVSFPGVNRTGKGSVSRQSSLGQGSIAPEGTSYTNTSSSPLPGVKGFRGSSQDRVDYAPGSSIQSQTTGSLNNAATTWHASSRGQGGAPTSKGSILATGSPNPKLLSRSASLSSGTDIDAEIRTRVEAKYRGVALRSKSITCDEFSDTEPRSKKRPKSALIIEPKADGETAVVSEVVQLRNSSSKDGSKVRRRSMEINLSSLAKTGLLSPSNLLNQSPASSPAVYPRGVGQRRKKRFGSLSTLPSGNRSSVVSVESLDPRTMISGQLQQNSYDFNSSIGSDLTSSMTMVSDLVPERRGAKQAAWNGNHVGVGNGMQPRKRSVSMDNLGEEQRQKGSSLLARLGEISGQLQEFIHKIAESRKCSLQSLELELHLGDLKAMSSLLEFHDLELTRYAAKFSPMARDKLNHMEKTKKFSAPDKTKVPLYSDKDISECREDVTKLRERVGLLRTHCDEATEQTEEVLEFVMQYERQLRQFKSLLGSHAQTVEAIKKEGEEYSEEKWMKLSKEFTEMTELKAQLQSICELSNHLLYLEPIFSGTGVREELTRIKANFQKLVLELFSLLESQAKNCAEQLLLDMSVLGSWVTETGLKVQALAKKSKKPNGVTSKLTDTRATLLQEVKEKRASLDSVSEKLEPIYLVLNTDDHKCLRDLARQLETNFTGLEAIEEGLQSIDLSPRSPEHTESSKGSSLVRSLYNRGKKQDKVQDRRSAEDRPHVSGRVFQKDDDDEDDDSGDENSPYARIDKLRRQILGGKGKANTLAPPDTGVSGGRPLSISEQMFSLPRANKPAPSLTVPDLYDSVEEVPSPFLDYDMVPSRSLDEAIEQLPHRASSSPFPSPRHSTPNMSPSHYATPASARLAVKKKVRYAEIDISLYDNPRLKSYKGLADEAAGRSEGEGSGEESGGGRKERKKHKAKRKLPHEKLLLFVGQEWKDLIVEVTPTTEDQLEVAMESISDPEAQEACKKFLLILQELEQQLKAVKEESGFLKAPRVPDLEGVHSSIDHCQKLRDRLDKLHPQVENCNEQCLEMTTPLYGSDSAPNIADSAPRAAQLLELRLFDVSTLWHMANMQVATCMRELRESESSVNSLHRRLSSLSRVLTEAREVLDSKQDVVDVEEYLKKCETLHSKLISRSEKRSKLAADIKEGIVHDPSAKVCEELLEQLKQIEEDWAITSKELSLVSSLEPVLVKRMLVNVVKEEAAVRACVALLREERGVEVEAVKENNRRCQECLLKARQMDVALTYTEKKLQSYIVGYEKTNPLSCSLGPLRGKSAGEGGGDENGPREHGISSIECGSMLEKCFSLKKGSKKTLEELDELYVTLIAESDLVLKFSKEYEELHVWLTDTQSMLEVTGSPSNPGGMGVPASPALLRGKHQAICQQVVTRQPKMELLHNLTSDLMQIPVAPSEKQKLENKISSLCTDWDELCQQCVPAGVLPLVTTPTGVGGSLKFKPPSEFEDISQMVEWLILIESKLQPARLSIGDFVYLKRLLRDFQGIERELRGRDKDYKRFMAGTDPDEVCSLLESDRPLSSSNTSVVGATALNFSPSKSVKFNDENTLERNLRQKEIQTNIRPGAESVESSIELSSTRDPFSPDSQGSVPYHSVGPNTGRRLEPNSDSPSSHYQVLQRLSSDPECSLSRVINSVGSSPMSLISEDHYHLALLWKSVWASLLGERKRLESVLERWKNFETIKEDFSKFLFKAEERMAYFLRVIGSARNFSVIQSEFAAQKSFEGELRSNEQRLSALNNLSHELITQYHKDDDSQDLKEAMADLNLRWKKMLEGFTPQQPIISALGVRWAEFYREFLSFEQCYRNLDIEMSNLNPFVTDMGVVKTQLEKLKLVQRELRSHDGTLEAVRNLAVKLVQGVGGGHVNANGVHANLDSMGKRWKHLQRLAVERKEALESALSEKQDFLSHLADCLSWLTQAEKHLRGQKPLGSDLAVVTAQYDTHQEFRREVQEQRPKMESVITSGRQMTTERHWPQETAEGLRSGYSGVENRWKWVWSEAEDWGKLLEIVLPEMEKFQSLCTECGKKLSDAEMIMDRFDSISRKIPILKRQLDSLQIYEQSMVRIGDILGILVTSQKRQLELGIKKSEDLFDLVKRCYQRWNMLKTRVEKRHADIEAAMVKYDPANLGVADLPQGWIRRKDEHRIPYYVNTTPGSEPQWTHPLLLPVYTQARADHTLPAYPSSSYPIALRLRSIQRRTQLSLLQTRQAMEAYEDYTRNRRPTSHGLSPEDTTAFAVDVFQRVEDQIGAEGGGSESQRTRFFINSAVELSICWIRDVFDDAHEGRVKFSSLMLALIALSSGKLDEKYKALFAVISGGRGSISIEQLVQFLEQIVQIPQLVSVERFCSLHALDICAKECFKKFVGVGRLHLPQFISWLQTEPLPLSWLPVLHRLAAAESSYHDMKCAICKTHPIVGFRYRCIQCNNLDMCQSCYWSGKSAKGHDQSKHYMEEYCLAAKSSDEMRDFFKSFQRSFRRRKKGESGSGKESMMITQGGGANPAPVIPPAEVRRRTWSNRGGSPPPMRSSSLRREEKHPGRRFTVMEDMESAWIAGEAGVTGGGVATHGQRRNRPRPPSQSDLGYAQSRSKPLPTNQDMDASFTKLTETTLNLSNHLKHMKEHQFFSDTTAAAPPTMQEVGPSKDALKQRNTSLQGRVQVLQEHNRRLEGCIAQLKLIAEMRQQQQQPVQPHPFHSTPHTSPFHTSSAPSNGIPPPLHNHSATHQQDHAHRTPLSRYGHGQLRPHNTSTPPNLSPQLGNALHSRPPGNSGGKLSPAVFPPRNGAGIPLPRVLQKNKNSHVERTLL